jgi:hypothetical protein
MTILSIPIVKAKGQFVSVDTEAVPEAVYQYCLELGLKSLINRGVSNHKQENFPTLAEFETESVAIAMRQYDAMVAGKTRIVGSKKTKEAGAAWMVEALRIAKISAKEQVKATGKIAVSKVKAAEWTKLAKAMIDADPEHWERVAMDSLSRSATAPVKGLDLLSMVQEDPELVRKAEKKKADSKKATAAKAAGKTTKPPAKAKKNPSHGVNG